MLKKLGLQVVVVLAGALPGNRHCEFDSGPGSGSGNCCWSHCSRVAGDCRGSQSICGLQHLPRVSVNTNHGLNAGTPAYLNGRPKSGVGQ